MEYQPLKEKKLVATDKKDTFFFILFYFLSVFSVNFSLFGAFHLGFTISCFMIFVAVAIYLSGKSLKITPFTIFCMLATLLFAVVPAIYSAAAIKLLSVFAVIALSALSLCGLCGVEKFPKDSYLSCLNIPFLWLIQPITELEIMFRSIFSSGEAGKNRKLLKIIIGLGCAVPVVAVIIPLLVRSDAAFEGFISNTIFNNFGRLLFSAIFGGVLFLFLFSSFFFLRKDNKSPEILSANTHKIDVAVLNAFLGDISFFYILYLLSQFAYFFSAFSNVLPENYTFAEYARRGFFEMSVICTINFALVFLSLILVKTDKSGKIPLSLRLFASFTSLFSILLTMTAFSKMYMYIKTYGLTRLRVTTSVFMAILFITFFIILIRLLFSRFPYFKVLVSCVSILLLVVLFADVDTMVVKYNVWAYQSGRHSTIDLATPEFSSDTAVPSLLSLLEEEDKEVVQTAGELLREKYSQYNEEETDIKSYNYSKEKARRLLKENSSRFMPEGTKP